jgi:hypothetical protein
MDSFQFWLYVIIAVIYLVSRTMKKRPANQPVDRPQPRPDKPVSKFEPPPAKPTAPSKQLTFEDLLKEIMESKTAEPKPPLPQEKYENYEEELVDEMEDLEDVNYDYRKDKVASEFQEAEQQAFLRPSLEETMRIENTDTKFEKFKVFKEEAQVNLMDKYLVDFYDPEGLKKAVVMSEILQRKF